MAWGGARRIIVLESRGRGRSEHAPAQTYTLNQELADLAAAMDAWGVERADFVGTSRGGLLAMLLGATAASRVGRVVLNDIGPTIGAEGLARIAAGVGAQMDHASYEALGEALRRTLEPQFPFLGAAGWRRFAEQLASPHGSGVRLDYDPALAETFRSTNGAQPDFWPAFDALEDSPVLVIRGAHSDILSAATVEAMRRRRPLQTLVIAHEGHAPLLWDRRSQDTIGHFLTG